MALRKIAYIVVCASLILSSCAPDIYTPTVISPKVTPYSTPHIYTATPANTATPASPSSMYGCTRPYTQASIWNTPIDWSKAHIHPESEAMIDAFFKDYSWIGSDTTQYSSNLYFVTNDTPLVNVQLQIDRSFRDAFDDTTIIYGRQGGTVQLPLPAEARPAPGTDGELAVVNVDSGEEWGLINGQMLSPGYWLAGGVYRYSIRNSGIPPKGFAHRGAGIGGFAGLIRPCEVARGFIGHAVTIAYDYPCASEICQANNWPDVILPFSKTDGIGTEKFDIPEGARLVIRPDIGKYDISKACSGMRGCIVWVQNMQQYGGFLVDDSDHPKTYGEGNATANWDPRVWSADMLQFIPPSWYSVLDWNYP